MREYGEVHAGAQCEGKERHEQLLAGLEEAPEVVVEIAFNDIQVSPIYPGGLALRFARVKRYRTDKRADEADTIGTVREIFMSTTGGGVIPRAGSTTDPHA